MGETIQQIVWAPQPGPQHAFVKCPIEEVFFGGARGGGKTDAVLGKWALKDARYGRAFNGIMFRRTMTSADDAIARSKQIYEPLGGVLNKTNLIWHMPRGGRVSFRYLDSIEDADHFQGRNLTDAWVEEAGQYPTPAPIDRLQGALRSPDGIPVQLILTANPGGAGQSWLRDRYKLHPLPTKPTIIERVVMGETFKAAVIPSKLSDNRVLIQQDPRYAQRLKLVGNEKLVQAWLDGDWSAIEGAYFDSWDSQRHVIESFPVPDEWIKIRAFDWGYAKPFSVGWWAVATFPSHGIRRGAMVRYREWYGASGPNVGLRMTAEEVAAGILERERERIDYSVADPAIFAEDGGPCIAERMGLGWQPADNKRVGQLGHLGGWDQMRARLRDDALLVFSTCTDFIRTVPTLQHDSKRAEDLDTDGEDHVADEARYACMSRLWIPEEEQDQQIDDGQSIEPRSKIIERKRRRTA